jgi:EAL domain-containing protein (putative c-di-GMP-specific phosphodiesterase class I)/DNA-binding response OmpR family regulator
MDQETAGPESAPREDISTRTEFLRRLPQEFEDLIDHWHIVRKRSTPLMDIKALRGRTEKLVDHLRDKRVERLFELLRRVDERLHAHVRMQQPLSRMDVDNITSLIMSLRQAGIEEVPAELRKRAQAQFGTAPQPSAIEAASIPNAANPVIFVIDPSAQESSTLAESLAGFGFDVHRYGHPDSAVRALSSQVPDAVVTRLPAGQTAAHASDFMKLLREKTPDHPPVLWVVDRADQETCLEILRAGGNGCVQEPIPMASLASRLRKLTPAQNESPHRVLLVHADPEAGKIRAAVLRDAGLLVESVDDATQALPAALRFRPEVMLVDASLPGMDGLELAHLWRQEDALRPIPSVLLCEGRDLVKSRHRLRELELDYLLHPFSEPDLLERLYLRASQYRSMTSTGTARMRSPSDFVERWQFEERLENFSKAPESPGVKAVLFLEVDGYGQLTRSHDPSIVGALPARMESALRPYLLPEDLPARYDDAAYAVLFHRDEPEPLEALEASLRQAVVDATREDLRLSDVRLRLGMARVGTDGDAWAALREAATLCRSVAEPHPATGDTMSEQCKRQSTTAPPPALDEAGRRHWSGRISDAILGRKLFLMFQPIHPASEHDTVERYEVLLRIREDSGTVLLPSEILAMAEQLGMGGLLDRWVIDTALGVLSMHQKASPDAVFFLKATGGTIQDDRFPAWLAESVRRHAPGAGSVVVQIREADAYAQRQQTHEMIRRLREQGIAVGLEHFGLRPGSLELLQSLDVDFVKLDRALVHDLAGGSKTAAPILKLLNEARRRGVRIIASYVENADSLARFLNERVDLVQGNFLHGPDPNLVFDRVL